MEAKQSSRGIPDEEGLTAFFVTGLIRTFHRLMTIGNLHDGFCSIRASQTLMDTSQDLVRMHDVIQGPLGLQRESLPS
jgi:hypothetical protein